MKQEAPRFSGSSSLFILLFIFPIFYKFFVSLKNSIDVNRKIITNIKKSNDLSETSYNLKILIKELENVKNNNDIYDFNQFLSSIQKTLLIISKQNDEISSLLEETQVMQEELINTNEELNKRQIIWKNTLEIMDKLTSYDKNNKFKLICETIQSTNNAYGVLIARVEKENLITVAFSGYGNLLLNKTYKATIEKSIAGRAYKTQKILWIENVGKDKDYFQVSPYVKSEIEIPLSHNNKYNGILEIAFSEHKPENKDLLETLIPVASALGSFLEVELAYNEIKESYKYLVKKLQSVTEIYHLESADHMDRIGKYAKFLAKLLNKTEEEQKDIEVFSRLHDIGKLKIAIEILTKNSSLTDIEMEKIKNHPIYGAELIGKAKWLSMARTICLTHHEKWDGSGYPKGLKGNEIPWEGQIVALVDVYDALRSNRTYKKEFTHEEAVNIILNGDDRTKPEHFNPQLLELFKNNNMEFDKIYNKFK